MRLPDSSFTDRPWRVHEIAPDFTVEDVWALPTPGGPHELDRFVRGFTAGEEDESGIIFRALFAIRWWIGRRLGWDRADSGARVPTVRDRLPDDLAEGARGPDFATEPSFTAVYQTEQEYVAELANRTVHALMHIGWVPDPATETHHAVMPSIVHPHGLVGRAYMTALRPIRRTLVYPSLVRSIGKEWPRYT